MIPYLVNFNTTTPSEAQLTDRLDGVTACSIKETLEGIYELTLTYSKRNADDNPFQPLALIVAKTAPHAYADTLQMFRIYKVRDSFGQVEVSARHVSYDLGFIHIGAVNAYVPAMGVRLNDIVKSYADVTDLPWSILIGIGSGLVQTTKAMSVRAFLTDGEESLREQLGARIVWDNYLVNVIEDFGDDPPLLSRNHPGVTVEYDVGDCAVLARSLWQKDGETVLASSSQMGDPGMVPHLVDLRYAALVDVTNAYTSKPMPASMEPLDHAQMGEALGKPHISIDAEVFAGPNGEIAPGVAVKLGDYLKVKGGDPIVDMVDKRIVETQWDSLLERYTEIVLDAEQRNFASTIARILRRTK